MKDALNLGSGLTCFLCARSDPCRHSVGSVVSDRRGQRADPDGHRLRSRPPPRAAAQPQGGQSSGRLAHSGSAARLDSARLGRGVNSISVSVADGGSEGGGQHRDGDGRADAGGPQLRRPLALPQPADTPEGEDQQGSTAASLKAKFFFYRSQNNVQMGC